MPTNDDRPAEEQRPGDRPQDEFVAARRPDPATPPTPTVELTGLLGDSDRPGYRRLYFTRGLDRYAEFRAEDVLAVADVPAEQPPLVGLAATRVILRRDAPVEFTRLRMARPLDEFDLDVRLSRPGARLPLDDNPFSKIDETGCGGGSLFCSDSCISCGGSCAGTCFSCHVTCADTCGVGCQTADCTDTCGTQCGTCGGTCGNTCAGTCNTCLTKCNQATCNTCQTNCGTCQTCETKCGTCGTCATCNPHIPACQ